MNLDTLIVVVGLNLETLILTFVLKIWTFDSIFGDEGLDIKKSGFYMSLLIMKITEEKRCRLLDV